MVPLTPLIDSPPPGTGRAKTRGRPHVSQNRKQAEDPEEDSDRERREQTLLIACKEDLRMVFTHWETPASGHAPNTPSRE